MDVITFIRHCAAKAIYQTALGLVLGLYPYASSASHIKAQSAPTSEQPAEKSAQAQPKTPQTSDTAVPVQLPNILLIPAEMVHEAAAKQYAALKQEAKDQNALNNDPATWVRVRRIAQKLIAQGARFNDQAPSWAWEVNLIDAPAINAFCMPGGKIAVYTGLIKALNPTDDELAAIIGHEIAHALLEHGRARMEAHLLKSVGVSLAASYFGLSTLSANALNQAATVAISLPYSRKHEVDSDVVGIELAARAGYDPRAAITVWEKMSNIKQQTVPALLSTHPTNDARIKALKQNMGYVLPLYRAAAKEQ